MTQRIDGGWLTRRAIFRPPLSVRQSTTLLHLLLLGLEPAEVGFQIPASRDLAIIVVTLPGVNLEERPDPTAYLASFRRSNLASGAVLQQRLHFRAIDRRAVGILALRCVHEQLQGDEVSRVSPRKSLTAGPHLHMQLN